MNHKWSLLVVVLCTIESLDCSLLSTGISKVVLTGEKPRFIITNENYKRLYAEVAGRSPRLKCLVDGNPKPIVLWFKDSVAINENNRRPGGVKYKKDGQVIVFESLTTMDDGLYTCVASNKYGSINRTVQLDVSEYLITEKVQFRPILGYGFPGNKTVDAGEDVEFRCVVYGDPNPHIRWIHNKSDHLTTLKSSGINVTDAARLHLKNVTTADEGQYTCLVGNSIGLSSASAWLTVLSEKPKWTKSSDAKTPEIIIEGNNARFNCRVKPDLAPTTMHWFKECQIITKTIRMHGFQFTKKGRAIVLKSMNQDDSGKYTCKASNRFGSIRRTYTLQVQAAALPCLLHGFPVDKRVYFGTDVDFKCIACGDPKPYIRWVRHLQDPVSTHYFDVTLKVPGGDQNMEVLHLKNVTYEDSGKYSCIAEDHKGITTQSAWLVVVPAPGDN